ncbi:hypothetical protein HDV02_001538 [Globomyces sp. JEL0801]|nr:hypothetical protein HDV02_001538 [Globomyces sp. JEL0801]
MLTLKRTNSDDVDFKTLSVALDKALAVVNGNDNDFFVQFNHVQIDQCVICYSDNKPIGIGGFKLYDTGVAELKRMFVDPAFRRKQVAVHILTELEIWGKELGFNTFVLETSVDLTAAMKFYQNAGYTAIERYGQYANVESSRCMKKQI